MDEVVALGPRDLRSPMGTMGLCLSSNNVMSIFYTRLSALVLTMI